MIKSRTSLVSLFITSATFVSRGGGTTEQAGEIANTVGDRN
ncbi:MAG: hypothetical protein AB8B64_16915 [Granulosicoccus sp.]